MQDWQQRVIEERDDLDRKIKKLTNFILSDKMDELSDHEKGLLREQHGYMWSYRTVLDTRILGFKL